MKHLYSLLLLACFLLTGVAKSYAQDGNGLPAKVSVPGNWGDVKLYKGTFDATQYPGFKVVLRERPAEGTVQLYYRNAAQAADFTGTYVTWEPEDEYAELSEDGCTLTGYFNNDNLEGDNVITEFALQNRTGNAIEVIIEHVYLLDEDDNEILTDGLKATGWNPATITEVPAIDPNAPIVEKLEIKVSDGAVIDSNQGDGNGLPAKVSVPGNWGDVKLYKGTFDATQYPGFKVVLRERPAEGTVQLYYRNAAQAADFTGTYVTWEPEDEYAGLSEDGCTLTGYFNNDNLEGDNVITEFALQNRTGNAIEVIIEHVYLLDEDDNEILTDGLKATGWNPATITELAGAQDKYSADVKWVSANGIVGPYSGTVEEGTWHKIDFSMESDLPEGFEIICKDASGADVACDISGQGTSVLSVSVRSDYAMIALRYSKEPTSDMKVHFNSIVRTIFKDNTSEVENLLLPVQVEYFSISGQKVIDPSTGIYLIREIFGNGTVRTIKRIF